MRTMTFEQRSIRIRYLREELSHLLSLQAREEDNFREDVIEECRKLKRDRRFVEAVRLYRHHTGLSLMEAKDVIDGLTT